MEKDKGIPRNHNLYPLDKVSTFRTQHPVKGEGLFNEFNFKFKIDGYWRKGVISVILSNSYIPIYSVFNYNGIKYKVNAIDIIDNEMYAYRLEHREMILSELKRGNE